jgi:allantoate deiminase
MLTPTSKLGQRAINRCDVLGEVPYSEDMDRLSRPYLTESHRKALETLKIWMTDARMGVRVDPMGNLIGRYEADRPNAPALLIGSHIDSVRDGGRYDGALGVMLGIECVEVLANRGRRLPFAIEVVAFGDEEGSRFPVSMLCSRALAHGLDEQALALVDEEGLSLQQALYDFGLDPERASEAMRRREDVIGYLEAHIEQGPVLEAEDLPIGVVTGIAAQLRIRVRFTGLAGHAGTTPMNLRRDAIAAASAAVLAVELVCRGGPADLRGTVGRISASTAAYNVIAGSSEIGIDIRAGRREVRDAAADEIRQQLELIAQSRGLQVDFTVVQDLDGCPCDPKLVAIMNQAVSAVGVPPLHLLSGAGHDGMALADLAPIVMLFIRCAGGVSHNAAESVDAPDVELAAQALVEFVERLGRTYA